MFLKSSSRKIFFVLVFLLTEPILGVVGNPSRTQEELPDPGSILGARENRPDHRRIRDLRIVTDGPVTRVTPEALRSLIGFGNGDPYSPSVARNSIQRLYVTGLFYDVQLSVDTAGEREVDLTFVLIRKFRVRQVEFSGNLRLGRELLRQNSRLRAGEAYNATFLDVTLAELASLYARNGYYLARIEPTFEVDDADASLKVIFQIEAGVQSRLQELNFDVEPGVELNEIRSIMQTRLHGPYSSEQMDRDIETIEQYLKRLGYFTPQVYVRGEVDYDPETNLAKLTLRVVPGRKTEVRFEGTTPPDEVLEETSLYSLRGIAEVYLEESVEQIRDYYQGKGYYFASIGVDHSPENGPIEEVVFRVQPGDRYSVSSVEFEGNDAISEEVLQRYLNVRKAGLFSRGNFTDVVARDDAGRIESRYQESGYLDAEADFRMEKTSDDQVRVVFRVAEGQRYFIQSLDVTGNVRISREELTKGFLAAPGEPFSPVVVAHDRSEVIAAYEDLGYREVDFASDYSISGNRVELRYRVTEGRPYFVDGIVVTGNQTTRGSVIQGQLLIEPGDPLSLSRLLGTETNLYDLLVFNRVEVKEAPSFEDDSRKTVLINVEEAKRFTLLYGIGYSSFEGPRGTFGITDSNFRGRARSLSLNTRVGSHRQRGSLSYSMPRFFGGRLPTIFSLTADNQKAQTTRTGLSSSAISGRPYDSFRLIAASNSEKSLSRRESFFFRYEFEKVQTTVPEGLEAPLEFFRQDNLQLSSVSISYLNESRSDPASPESGFFLSGDAKFSSRVLGSEAELFRIFPQGQYYRTIFPGVVWMAALRLGLVIPYGRTETVPISERYFSGGATTIRGVPHDLAGPLLRDEETGEVILVDENGFPDENGRPVPLGGEALAIFNTEIRFPLVSILRGTVFYDLGNVFGALSDIPRTPMINAIGLGLNVQTPVGPIRFDAGYNPSPPDIPGFKHWNFYFTLGNPF